MQNKTQTKKASEAPEASMEKMIQRHKAYGLTVAEAPNIKEGATLGALIEKHQAQHSPLPWHHEQESATLTPRIKSGAIAVARCVDAGKATDANAKLIVRSVNSAEKLAEALRVIQGEMNALRQEKPNLFSSNPFVSKERMRRLGLRFDWSIVDKALAQWEARQK